MLFNSYEFIFLFLVPVLFGFFMSRKHSILYLIIVSVVFYAQWSLEHLFILLSSVVVNYVFARVKARSFSLLWLIVVLNLIPLLYYKYSNFLNMSDYSVVLPLAISFFTFQQIAFQVDLYYARVKLGSFEEYLFFILFFPQLVAGPIVHYNELIPQIRAGVLQKFNELYFNVGITLFSMGLFKKVVLADNFAPLANHAFSNVSTLSSYEAWLSLFAYSFQIYFDFSGYADMAVGLALFFGVKLPINFNSPYRSRNIIEFWRRWHITLSHFLKEHIYIPLGGNRHGVFRATLNLLITMVIGGIWHGAGWTFLLWGFLHGIFLGFVHLIDKRSSRIGFASFTTVLTFLVVTLLWVLFRADNFGDAVAYYEALFRFELLSFDVHHFGDEFLVFMGFVIVWFLPNSLDVTGYLEGKMRVGVFCSFMAAVMFFVALKFMASAPAQTFVYFNF